MPGERAEQRRPDVLFCEQLGQGLCRQLACMLADDGLCGCIASQLQGSPANITQAV